MLKIALVITSLLSINACYLVDKNDTAFSNENTMKKAKEMAVQEQTKQCACHKMMLDQPCDTEKYYKFEDFLDKFVEIFLEVKAGRMSELTLGQVYNCSACNQHWYLAKELHDDGKLDGWISKTSTRFDEQKKTRELISLEEAEKIVNIIFDDKTTEK